MNKDMASIGEKDVSDKKNWYAIEQLSELSGILLETFKGGHSSLKELSIGIETNTRLGGYHNTQKILF